MENPARRGTDLVTAVPVVVDASVAAAWLLPDECSETAEDWFAQACADEGRFWAPALWCWEVGNLLLMAARRGRIAPGAVEAGLDLLLSTRVAIEDAPTPEQRRETLRLARESGLTFYDAAYLELAKRRSAQLASRDRQLIAAARARGVECLEL